MEKAILNLIERKAGKAIAKMSDSKAHTFVMAAYAGLRFCEDHFSLSQIADELCYTESGIHKLVVKWKKMLDNGDVNAHLIRSSYIADKKATATVPKEADCKPKTAQVVVQRMELPSTYVMAEDEEEYNKQRAMRTFGKAKVRKCLGFIITQEDEARERAAIRGAIRFFANYGKGAKPRMHGEVFSPEEDKETHKTKGVWIPQEQAVLYCGCTEKRLTAAATQGFIKRRAYKRSGNHLYYEYLCSDLDRFINEHHLL